MWFDSVMFGKHCGLHKEQRGFVCCRFFVVVVAFPKIVKSVVEW